MTKLRIVFLDASTVDLGDINLSALKKLGRWRAYSDTPPWQIVPRSQKADIVITNKCVFSERELRKLPRLKMIAVAATGVNNVDLKAAQKRGIAVTNVAGYSTTTVAEHTLLFLLAFSHRLLKHHTASISRDWSRSPHFALFDYPFSDLRGKTLGIVGLGRIGKEVARLAKNFGMKVQIARLPGHSSSGGANRTPLTRLLRTSDFVTLHCPLTALTKGLMNRKTLSLMKRGGVLINMARGPIVDEKAVAAFLKKGHLAGYGADVMEREPPPRHHPFFQKNFRGKILLTPHVAWASRESRQRLVDEIAANIRAFLAGRRKNRIV